MIIVLGFAVLLFVSEIVRVDFAAIIVMALLGCLASLPGLDGLVDMIGPAAWRAQRVVHRFQDNVAVALASGCLPHLVGVCLRPRCALSI
jgi:hypothetical protein